MATRIRPSPSAAKPAKAKAKAKTTSSAKGAAPRAKPAAAPRAKAVATPRAKAAAAPGSKAPAPRAKAAAAPRAKESSVPRAKEASAARAKAAVAPRAKASATPSAKAAAAPRGKALATPSAKAVAGPTGKSAKAAAAPRATSAAAPRAKAAAAPSAESLPAPRAEADEADETGGPPSTSAARPSASDDADDPGEEPTYEDGPLHAFADGTAWSAWLAENHSSTDGVWIQIAKKASGIPSVAYPEVLEIALAWGWIDAVRHSRDDTWFLQRFTRRNPRSTWSKINRDKAVAMIEDGRMQPPGLAEVERARADGRWDAAYDGQRTATVPDDLAAALDARPGARDFFERLDSRNRYAVLFRLQGAKKPETRARRIDVFAAMLARGDKLYP